IPCKWISSEAGIPKGAITEVHGLGKTEWVSQLLRNNPSLNAAWIEREIDVYPVALEARGIDLSRILFLDLPRDNEETAEWSVLQVIYSQLFPVIVVSS